MSGDSISVDSDKTKAVMDWQRATTVIEIRSFLGLAVIPHTFMRLPRILSEFKIPKKWFDSKINYRINSREWLGT